MEKVNKVYKINSRDDSVTISKALGIILMVLAHSGFSQIGDATINMFHMPLFFFMSGYCFSDCHLTSPKSFLCGKIKKVYYPYVKYSLLFLLLHNVFFLLHLYKDSDGIYTIQDFLFQGIRIIVSMGMHDQLLGGYWFMGNLFWGVIIAYMLLNFFKNKAMTGILISLATCFIMDYTKFQIPVVRVDFSDFFSSAFILAGIQYKRGGYRVELKPFYIIPIAFIFVVLGVTYWRGCVPIIEAWKIIPYYITAIVGTLAVFCIAKFIEKYDTKVYILKKIGLLTFAILTWHFLCFKFVSWIIILIYNLPIDRLAEFPVISEYSIRGWWVVYFLIGIIVPMGIDSLINAGREYLKVILKRIYESCCKII